MSESYRASLQDLLGMLDEKKQARKALQERHTKPITFIKGGKKMSDEILAIVLFEDTQEEVENARKAVEEKEGVIISSFVFNTLEDAGYFFGKQFALFHVAPDKGFSHLKTLRQESVLMKSGRGIIGILTDLYMPSRAGEKPEPVGAVIAMAAKKAGLPVVVCTSGGHRLSHWAEAIIEMLDVPVVYNKDWSKAIEVLQKEAEKLK